MLFFISDKTQYLQTVENFHNDSRHTYFFC